MIENAMALGPLCTDEFTDRGLAPTDPSHFRAIYLRVGSVPCSEGRHSPPYLLGSCTPRRKLNVSAESGVQFASLTDTVTTTNKACLIAYPHPDIPPAKSILHIEFGPLTSGIGLLERFINLFSSTEIQFADPATPFANAQKTADLLGDNAFLVEQLDFGHASLA
ncbi:hypothetical protein BJ322DRAFT_131400 [Thelephora terrestris]|uniref:Uncharacterized protein n=1 Tax=Thelephora terrestris TaxID=56493 RepID=A0A9P6HV93_9AGAM|nr:hypothetical protein BJ322DRAFT_131400 [Thelephora terrestris]